MKTNNKPHAWMARPIGMDLGILGGCYEEARDVSVAVCQCLVAATCRRGTKSVCRQDHQGGCSLRIQRARAAIPGRRVHRAAGRGLSITTQQQRATVKHALCESRGEPDGGPRVEAGFLSVQRDASADADCLG